MVPASGRSTPARVASIVDFRRCWAEDADLRAVRHFEVEPVEHEPPAERITGRGGEEWYRAMAGGRGSSMSRQCTWSSPTRHPAGVVGPAAGSLRSTRPTPSCGPTTTSTASSTRCRSASGGCNCRRPGSSSGYRGSTAGGLDLGRGRLRRARRRARGRPDARGWAAARRLRAGPAVDFAAGRPAAPLDGRDHRRRRDRTALIELLEPFGVDVLAVTRRGTAGMLPADRLGEVLPAGHHVVIAALRRRPRSTLSATPSSRRCARTVAVNVARGALWVPTRWWGHPPAARSGSGARRHRPGAAAGRHPPWSEPRAPTDPHVVNPARRRRGRSQPRGRERRAVGGGEPLWRHRRRRRRLSRNGRAPRRGAGGPRRGPQAADLDVLAFGDLVDREEVLDFAP